jgi:hypothetical protein
MAQSLGLAQIRFDGKLIPSEKGAKIKLGGIKRTPVLLGKSTHYAEEFEAAEVECVTSLLRGMSLQDLRDARDITVIFECDTGQTFVVRNAFATDVMEVTDGEGGKITVKFAGDAAEEML